MSSEFTFFSFFTRSFPAFCAICVVLGLSACESLNLSNWFGNDEQDSPYAGQEAPGSDQSYPDVSSVPERPAEGLIADTRDRLYAEDEKQPEQNQETAALEEEPSTNSRIQSSSREPTPAPVQSVVVDTMSPPSIPPEPPTLDADTSPQPMPLSSLDETATEEMTIDETATVELTPTAPEQRFVSIKMGTLFFPFGSSYISPDDRRHIKKVVDLAKEKNAVLRVVGHASSFTNNMPLLDHQIANFSVSLERAQAIARLILANGFDNNRLLVSALSDSKPLFLEVMPAGRQGNQRAEIYMEY